jgi:hypothetical protein
VGWIGLALVNAVKSLRVPQNAGKLSGSYAAGGLSSSAQVYRVSQSVSQSVSKLVSYLRLYTHRDTPACS